MRNDEFNALYDLAPELAKYIELGKIECGESYSNLMTFNLSGTEPPKKQFAVGCDTCGNAANCFSVSTTELLNYFDQQQEQIEEAEQLTPIQRFLNTRGQMEHLKRNLSVLERNGDSKRIKGGGFLVELVAEFSDICTFLSKDTENTAVNSDIDNTIDDIENWTTTGGEAITVEDTDAWTSTGIIRAGLRKTISKVINHSRGGYCLYIDSNEKFQLRVGELVIVKQSDSRDWHAAVIIWVSGHKKRMDFGVKLLEGVVTKGTLTTVYSKDSEKIYDCLFLKVEYGDDDSSIKIITASHDFYKGDKLLVNYKGNEYRVTVEAMNSKTNGYVEYICDWSDTQDDVAVKVPSAREFENDFESIWDEL
jgi:hypothetical protein